MSPAQNRGKKTTMTAPVVLLVLALAMAAVCSTHAWIQANRLPTNPLVGPTTLPFSFDGTYDTNFPTVIAAPDWLEPRLGDYYMFFSDHHGLYISLAYSNSPQGPWMVYAPPVLTLGQVYAVNGDAFNVTNRSESAEVASADVFVDNVNRRLGMYFHARVPANNYAILAGISFSDNGLNFTALPGFLTTAYVRHFTWSGDRDHMYLLNRFGQIVQTDTDGYSNVVSGGQGIGDAFANATLTAELGNNGYNGLVRHLGVSVVGNTMYVFGSRVGDSPEHILWTEVDLECIRTNWSACAAAFPAQNAFETQYWYEGSNYPIMHSLKGSATGVHQLRDPYPFHGHDGNCYIYYASAGESYIAGAIISPSFCFADGSRTSGGGRRFGR